MFIQYTDSSRRTACNLYFSLLKSFKFLITTSIYEVYEEVTKFEIAEYHCLAESESNALIP